MTRHLLEEDERELSGLIPGAERAVMLEDRIRHQREWLDAVLAYAEATASDLAEITGRPHTVEDVWRMGIDASILIARHKGDRERLAHLLRVARGEKVETLADDDDDEGSCRQQPSITSSSTSMTITRSQTIPRVTIRSRGSHWTPIVSRCTMSRRLVEVVNQETLEVVDDDGDSQWDRTCHNQGLPVHPGSTAHQYGPLGFRGPVRPKRELPQVLQSQ